MKKKLLIGVGAVLLIVICVGAALLAGAGSTYYYTQIDNSKVERIAPHGAMNYSYTLPSYNEDGEERSITFETARELNEVAFVLLAQQREANYYQYTETVGEIEKKYTALGDKEVSYKEYDADGDVIGKYAVWYPTELKSGDNKYPVVIFANGTGSTSSTYKPFLTHLSSWGFISVGNDDKNTRTGVSLEETIKFLIAENENKDSVFYHKIDLYNIGIAGHSQGGPAMFNMAANQEHGYMVKSLYAASATSSYHTMVMADGWGYDISRVNIPTFLTAGTGSWDAGNATSKVQVTDDKNGVVQGICPLWSLQENYNLLSETVDKVIARKKNVDHGDSYKQFDGYMTAWFMYYLQGDTDAGAAFTIGGELFANSLYQDVQANILLTTKETYSNPLK